MHLKMSSVKCQPFFRGPKDLTIMHYGWDDANPSIMQTHPKTKIPETPLIVWINFNPSMDK